MKATDAQNHAYRQGLCIGLCGERYSAGRSRCNACHVDSVGVFEPELVRKGT